MDWLKKNREWLATLAVILFFVLLLLLSNTFFKSNSKNNEPHLDNQNEAQVELPSRGKGGQNNSASTDHPQTTSFFLRPSPEELLKKLEGLNFQEFNEEVEKLPGLRVMWPAYFFSVEKIGGNKGRVMLDTSEDGFGIILTTEIDFTDYPEVLQLKRGKKIWLAAEISGVDTTGTGEFLLATEHIRFDDYQPPVNKRNSEKNK